MLREHLALDRQHTLVDEAVAIVVRPVAHLVARKNGTFADDAAAIWRARVQAPDAHTYTRPIAAGLAERRPVFIDCPVPVVVDAIAPLDLEIQPIIWRGVIVRCAFVVQCGLVNGLRLELLATPIDHAQRLGTSQLAAADGQKQRAHGQRQRRAARDDAKHASQVGLQE